MQPIDCLKCKTKIGWHSVDASHIDILTGFVWSTILGRDVYSHYAQQIYQVNVYSFAFRSFEASNVLIHYNIWSLHDEWHRRIMFQHIWLAIYHMLIHSHAFDICRSTSSPGVIQLLLLDFKDVMWANFKIWTMCTTFGWRLQQLNAWINAAWPSRVIIISIIQSLLLLCLIWYHWLKFCLYIMFLIQFLLSHITAAGRTISSSLDIYKLDL